MLQVVGDLQERLVHRVDMDVFPGHVPEVDRVNAGRVLQIKVHARHRHNVVHARRNFKDPAAVADAQRFHGRGNGKADGFVRPVRVGNDQIHPERVKPPFDTFHGGIK